MLLRKSAEQVTLSTRKTAWTFSLPDGYDPRHHFSTDGQHETQSLIVEHSARRQGNFGHPPVS
jgi:hypothetical protein